MTSTAVYISKKHRPNICRLKRTVAIANSCKNSPSKQHQIDVFVCATEPWRRDSSFSNRPSTAKRTWKHSDCCIIHSVDRYESTKPHNKRTCINQMISTAQDNGREQGRRLWRRFLWKKNDRIYRGINDINQKELLVLPKPGRMINRLPSHGPDFYAISIQLRI